MHTISTGRVEIDQVVSLHYALYTDFDGSASKDHDAVAFPKLLFLNGSMSDTRRKCGVQEYFAKAGFQVLTYDYRGMGQSTMDTNEEHYTMKQYASDAISVLKHLGWNNQEFFLFGASFGGMVLQELLINYQDSLPMVNKAVFACSPGKLPEISRQIGDTAASLSTSSFLSQWLQKIDIRYSKFPGKLLPILVGFIGSLIPQVKHIDSAVRSVYWNKCRIFQLKARGSHNTLDRIAGVKLESIVAGGSRDLTCPPHKIKELVDLLPNADMKIFEGSHMFYMSKEALACFKDFFFK
mmetsp:Transcript_18617/g.23684  ORF Transcript_18617/g.23684 Transcript_18617/m.23684 type:complete len:295 (-) Transcript_18617:932-1816(-)